MLVLAWPYKVAGKIRLALVHRVLPHSQPSAAKVALFLCV